MTRARFALVTGGSLGVLAAIAAQAQAPAPVPASPKEAFIVGGKPVNDIKDAHWQVALMSGTFQFCGGSLIATNWVLTAAHCVDNGIVQKDPKRLDVLAGTLNKTTGGVRSNVDKMFVNPKWTQTDKQFDFDATLLKLKTPVTVVQPIDVIAPNGTLATGVNIMVSGWGATSEGGPASDILRFVLVPVVSTTDCNKPESYDGRITDQMFCAGAREGGLDSCQGDSGGPVMSVVGGNEQLVGVVSWGFGCARALKYGVYTRVSAVSQWISDTMAANK
jgi:secreted trypsin-like serine protease